MQIYQWKWHITSLLAILFAALLVLRWHWSARQLLALTGLVVISALLVPGAPQLPFAIAALGLMLLAAIREQDQEWATQTWSFTKQIMPLLLGGVFIAGLLLGRPGYEGLIPSEWVSMPVGSQSKAIPKIVDLGARKCIPCKMKAPILEELKVEYRGQFDVVFIDVWENGAAIDQYGVRIIPTQIFIDSEGEELFRHEGFFSKEDILGTWKEFGMDISTLSET